MDLNHRSFAVPHLVWVWGESANDALDAATWLDTTYELRKLGWCVTLVAAGPAGQQSVRGIEVFCIPKPQVYFIRQVVFHVGFLGFLARKWATTDVILFHVMAAPWVLPLRFVRLLTGQRRPLVVMDTRTLAMISPSKESWKDRLRRVFRNFMEQWVNCWADGRLAITRRMAESVRIPSERLWGVWPSGVNLDRFAPALTARRWPSSGEPIHLVYIGSMDYARNLMALSRAVEKANAEGMAFILSLVGDGTEWEELEEFARQTAERIRVAPPEPHDRVWELLAQAHVGALPFPDEEKFRVSSPVKLFEYMASGLSILATRIACHTDVIGNSEYVFWVEQADVDGLVAALRLVWQGRCLLSEMGSRAATAAQAWTWRESAKKLKMALDDGLAKHG